MLLLALVLGLMRALALSAGLETSLQCDCVASGALLADVPLWAGLILLCALASRGPRWWMLLPMALAVLVVLLQLIDLGVLLMLQHRLLLDEWGIYGGRLGTTLGVIRQSEHLGLFVLLGGAWLLASVLALAARPHRRWGSLGLGVAALGLVAAMSSPNPARSYVAANYIHNVLQLQWPQGVDQPYSAEFVAQLPAAPAASDCTPGANIALPIILVVVESLSAHWSGPGAPASVTPRLDALVQRHAHVPDFMANGFTTDHGLIALLLAEAPVPPLRRYRSMSAFAGRLQPRISVPHALHQHGYHSAFLTTADLGFTQLGEWLQAIGYQTVEGMEAPFYASAPKRFFGAAEDEWLYRRARQWMAGAPTPYLLTLLTVSSHPPFADPRDGSLGLPASLRYVDDSLADFIEGLEAEGFLERGIVIVVGDHRGMLPLTAEEYAAEGAQAYSRVPLWLFGPAAAVGRGALPVRGQQMDLLPSLLALTQPQACAPAGHGRFLGPALREPAARLFVRGDARDLLDVYTAQGQHQIRWNGDASHWVDGREPIAGMLSELNRQRAALGTAEDNFVEQSLDARVR